jgi:hypothetical protein
MYLREKGLMFQFPMIVLGRSWSAARKGGNGATGNRDGWTTVGGRYLYLGTYEIILVKLAVR